MIVDGVVEGPAEGDLELRHRGGVRAHDHAGGRRLRAFLVDLHEGLVDDVRDKQIDVLKTGLQHCAEVGQVLVEGLAAEALFPLREVLL